MQRLERIKLGSIMKRAPLFATVILLLLRSVPGSFALAQDEAARAPLPPPLPTAPPEPSPATKAESSGAGLRRDQPVSGQPTISLDRPEYQSSERSTGVAATAHRRAAAGNGRTAPFQPSGHAAGKASRHSGRRAIASRGRPNPSEALAPHEAGHLSPPDDYSAPRIESAATAPATPLRSAIPYFREPPASTPAYSYVPVYPFPWPPPAAGPFR